MSTPAEFIVKIDWHSPDAAFAAVLVRDGQPWFLDGALVGMGATPGEAVTELCGIARHLVIHGENFLTDALLSRADRKWLFWLLDPRTADDEMYMALRALGVTR